MRSAKVIGTATSTVKHPSMLGRKLLIVQPCLVDEVTSDGEPLLVVDAAGAGRGDTVMITSDGRFSRALVNDNNTPVRWTAIGIRDA